MLQVLRRISCLATVLMPLAVLQAQPALVLSQLVWFDRMGMRLGAIGPLADHGNVELSPDGTRAAVAVTDRGPGTRDIWMYDATSGARVRFTEDAADENWLIWSPDGRRVVLNAFEAGRLELFEAPAESHDMRRLLLANADGKWPVSWSPDGRVVLFVSNARATGNDIWVLPLTGDQRPYPYLQTAASENWAAFSPDGKFVAFSATSGGEQPEVYVAPFPADDRRWRVSADGGTQARWRRDGREIYYVAPDRMLMVSTIETTASAVVLRDVVPLFRLSFPYGAYHAFDVTADGQRFLVNTLAVDPRGPATVARGTCCSSR